MQRSMSERPGSGRASDLQALHACLRGLDDVGTTVATVRGAPGTGKTHLLGRFAAELDPDTARVVWADARVPPGERPYGTFSTLIASLVLPDRGALDAARSRLETRLGSAGMSLLGSIDGMHRLVGDRPAPPPLDPIERAESLRRVLTLAFEALVQDGPPTVVLVDGLDGVDGPSRELLVHLVHAAATPWLLVGTSRPEDPAFAPPARSDAARLLLELAPLSVEAVTQQVATALQLTPEAVQHLGTAVHGATLGVPLAVDLCLTWLAEEGVLDGGGCSLELLEEGLADRTGLQAWVDRLLDRLPDGTRRAIGLCTHLGRWADLGHLAAGLGVTELATRALLEPARELRVLTITPDGAIRFTHRTFADGARARLAAPPGPEFHLGVAGHLVEEGHSATDPFAVAEHFDHARRLEMTAAERGAFVSCCLQAGRSAVRSVAFEQAARALRIADEELPEAPWEDAYELTFAVRVALAEALFGTRDRMEAEGVATEVISRARTPSDHATILSLWTVQNTAVGLHSEAVEQGCTALRLMGEDVPRVARLWHVAAEQLRVEALLWRRGEDRLDELPRDEDPDSHRILDLYMDTAAPAYLSNSLYGPLLTLRIIRRTLERGSNAWSAFAFGAWAAMLARRRGAYRRADRFGRLALRLSERHPNPRIEGRVLMAAANLLDPWTRPIAATSALRELAYDRSLQAGDVLWAIHCYVLGFEAELTTRPLLEVQSRWEALSVLADEAGLQSQRHLVDAQLTLVRVLRGELPFRGELAEHPGDATRAATTWADSGYTVGVYYQHVALVIGHLLTEDSAAAWRLGRRPPPGTATIRGAGFTEALYTCLRCLAALDGLGDPTLGRAQRLERSLFLTRSRRRLAGWTETNPALASLAALVEAEVCRREHDITQADVHYDHAWRAADDASLQLIVCLTAERRTRMLFEEGAHEAPLALARARKAYTAWGALGRVEALERFDG